MISVVIPALDEASSIAQTVTTASEALSGAGIAAYEVIVIDDGSSDATGAEAVRAGARVITHPRPAGYGRSLKDGIRAARFDLIAICDADQTYPLDQLPQLITVYKRGFDMVVGARTGRQYRESLVKMPMRVLLQALVEWTTGTRIPDVNSGLRLFSRRSILWYLDRLCDTFSFTTSLTLAYLMTGRSVAYVPIPYNARVGKSKVKLFRDSLRTLQYITEAITFYNPLKLFLLLALIAAAIGTALVGAALVSNSVVLGIVGGMGFVCAALMFGLGLVATLLRHGMVQAPPAVVEAIPDVPMDIVTVRRATREM